MKNKFFKNCLNVLAVVLVAFLPFSSQAATRNIVPRADGEGSIGTSAKAWGDGYFSDLHVGGNSVFANLQGTNGVDVDLSEGKASIGLDMTGLDDDPKFLKWDGTNFTWSDTFDVPGGMEVPAYLARKSVPAFQQQQSVTIPGTPVAVYENEPGEELDKVKKKVANFRSSIENITEGFVTTDYLEENEYMLKYSANKNGLN